MSSRRRVASHDVARGIRERMRRLTLTLQARFGIIDGLPS
jgi:hypothetical protein